MIELIFLGTSSAFPTKERGHPSVLLRYEGDRFLFDCGEGTQRQLLHADRSAMKINSIFLTHWHGDHSLGLPGLLQSLSLQERKRELSVYGPKRTNKRIKYLLKAFPFNLTFEIRVGSIDYKTPKTVTETDEYSIKAVRIPHGIKTLAYSFQEKDQRKINLEYTKELGLVEHPKLGELQKGKTVEWKGKKITPEEATYVKEGKKITYIGEGRPDEAVKDLASDSDILIVESTFSSDLKEKAEEAGHLTAKKAAEFAKEVNAKKLFLTHFSRRYKDTSKLKKEAEKIFKNVELAEDFKEIGLRG